MNPERLATLRQWYSEHSFVLMKEMPAQNNVDESQILLRLLIRLPECESETSEEFLLWARRLVEEEIHERIWYESFKNLKMADVLALARTRRRRNCKPMLTETHGDRTFVKLERKGKPFVVWVIPSQWLPVAEALWPVHAKYSRSIGWWVCKTSRRESTNGKWIEADIPVHHVYVDAKAGERVIAQDGSFLNYLPGNLEVENDGAERDVDNPDAAPTHAIPLLPTDTKDATFAKPTAVVAAKQAAIPSWGSASVDTQVRLLRETWGIRQDKSRFVIT